MHSSRRDSVSSGSASEPVCRQEPAAPRQRPPSCGPCCNVRPTDTPSRLYCGSWPPASLRLPESSCQKGGTALLPPGEPAGAGGFGEPEGAGPPQGNGEPHGTSWGKWDPTAWRRQETEAAEDGALLTQKGREEKEVTWPPHGIRPTKGRKRSGGDRRQLNPPGTKGQSDYEEQGQGCPSRSLRGGVRTERIARSGLWQGC